MAACRDAFLSSPISYRRLFFLEPSHLPPHSQPRLYSLRSIPDRPFFFPFYFRFESKKRHHLRDEKGFNGKSKESLGKKW